MTDAGTRPLTRALVLVMAVATGLSAASLYYAQPLLPQIERSVHLGSSTAGLLVTLTQVGYALGLLFVIPLGDVLERRRLLTVLSLVLALALVVVALSPDAAVILVASVVVGSAAVVAQVLVPFAADLAVDAERGRVVGTVMSGLLVGILLARTVAGLVAAAGGWRAIYVVAAVLVIGQSIVLRRVLPESRASSSSGYLALLHSVAQLARAESLLRRRALLGGLGFFGFSVLWTSVAFLLSGAPFHYGSAVIGLFGLVGAGGALAASFAGRMSDRGHSRGLTVAMPVLLTLSWLPIWWGRHSVAALVVGILVLDLAVQGLHVTNQSLIYEIQPNARARVNSVYMTTYFTGGAIGSALSAVMYQLDGWEAVSILGAVAGGVTVAVAVLGHDRQSPQSADAPSAAPVRSEPEHVPTV